MKFFKIVILLVIMNFCLIFGQDLNSIDLFEGTSKFIVVGNSINVRQQPNAESEVIIQLRFADVVEILKKSTILYQHEDVKGKWVYVETGYYKDYMKSEKYCGWVLDYYLAQGNKFKKVSNFYSIKLIGVIGDYKLNYGFNSDGSFLHIYQNPFSKKIQQLKGYLYKYRNVIIAKDSQTIDYFFVEENLFCHANFDKKKSLYPICSKLN